MSEDITYPPGTVCEVTPLRPTKDKSMPQRSIPHLYQQLRDARNKAEMIDVLWRCGWIPKNEVPKDVWEKVKKWSNP